MKSVLNAVVSQDPEVRRRGTSAYINDLCVNEEVVKASRGAEHLHKETSHDTPLLGELEGASMLLLTKASSSSCTTLPSWGASKYLVVVVVVVVVMGV